MIPFTAVRSPHGDIVVFYVGSEPRMTPDQALAFADQLRALAADAHPAPVMGSVTGPAMAAV
ncbi:hypothetical protein [Nonomuraea sp. NPDC050783]|uniref:hypothetical protein n=1 Tax=Nonomuraea sp. NPDC050783 TaxID=3154634 RepID=UPI003465E8C2